MFKAVLITFFLIQYVSVLGQVTITGHVSAEVVESVAVENGLLADFSLNKHVLSVELGSLKVASVEKYEYDISVNNALIYNSQSTYPLHMTYSINETADEGIRDISFSALTDREIRHGNYDGDLTVVVSFN